MSKILVSSSLAHTYTNSLDCLIYYFGFFLKNDSFSLRVENYNFLKKFLGTIYKRLVPVGMTVWVNRGKYTRQKFQSKKISNDQELIQSDLISCPQKTLRFKCNYISEDIDHENLSRDITKQTKCLCAQRRLWSAWASAQSDQSLRCLDKESLGP